MSNISVDYDVLNQRGSPAWFTDTFANIPTAGFVGRMFISTDTFAFYRDTGTGWDLIGGPGIGTLTGSGATGQVSFFNGTQVLTGSNNLFWDNTNGRLGIGTATPSAPLDIHATGTNATFNGTSTNNAYLVFQNAGASKWRIGNTYNAGANSFDIYNNGLANTPFSISSTTNAITLAANVTTTGIQGVQNGLNLGYANGGVAALSTILYGATTGINFGLANGTGGANFIFQTANGYNYTFPATTGTIAILEAGTQTFTGTLNVLGPLGTKYGISIEKGNTPSPLSANDIFIYASSGATNIINFANSSYKTTLSFPTSNQTYTFPATTGTLALTSDLTSYLPLTGGTLTGALGGTSASFSSTATATAFIPSGATVPTNGIYLSAANTLDFATNTTNRLSINSAGNIGISTTSPVTTNLVGSMTIVKSYNSDTPVSTTAQTYYTNQSNLYLFGRNAGLSIICPATSEEGSIFFGNSLSVAYASINTGSGTTSVGGDMNFRVGSNTTRMTITSAGNVSIVGSAFFQPNQWEIFPSAGGSNRAYAFSVGNIAAGDFTISQGSTDTGGTYTPRLVITSGGVLCVGTTAGFTSGLVCSDGGTSFVPFAAKVGTTANSTQIFFNNPNGVVGSITTSGSVTSYNVTSDYRLKQDFKDYNGLDLVSSIKTYDYEWKSDNTRMYGVMAHELAEVIPYAVQGIKDGKEMQGVDYSKIVPILVKAIQELNKKLIKNNIN